jgi:hypothetical protein
LDAGICLCDRMSGSGEQCVSCYLERTMAGGRTVVMSCSIIYGLTASAMVCGSQWNAILSCRLLVEDEVA